jgi:hypothetical protein
LRSYAVTATITPEHAVSLAGRGGRTQTFRALADPLEINVLGLRGSCGIVVFVSIDALFASNDLKAEVLAGLSDPQRSNLEDVIFIASHTHNAPQLDATKPVLGLVDPTYFRFVVERTVTAIEQLLDDQHEKTITKVSVGKGYCDASVVRRKRGLRLSSKWPYLSHQINLRPNPAHELYRDIDIAMGCDENGHVIWVIWSWTCHATATHLSNDISADFPGAIRKDIRKFYNDPGLPVLFLPGFCGDVRSDPGFSLHQFRARLSVPFARPFPPQTKSNYDQLCSRLTASVLLALSQLKPIETHDRAVLTRAAITLADLMTTQIPGDMEVCNLDCGALSFLLIGGEVCSPYRKKIAALAKQGTWLSGYMNHVQCYLPDDSQLLEGGYEVTGFFESFGHSGPFHSKIEGRVMATVRDLLAKARSK